MFQFVSDVVLVRPVFAEHPFATGVSFDRVTQASVVAAHDDMCSVLIPPLFKYVKISLIVAHV